MVVRMLAVREAVLELRTQQVPVWEGEALMVALLAWQHYLRHLVEALEELEACLVVEEAWRVHELVLQRPREGAEV